MYETFIRRAGKIFFVWNECWEKYEFWQPTKPLGPKPNRKPKLKRYTSGFVDRNRGRHFDRKARL